MSRVQPAIAQPPPVPLVLTWQGGVLPRAGFSTNLPAFYRVEVSTNLTDWRLLTNIIAPGPLYSVTNLAGPRTFYRYRPAAAWEVSP